MKSGPFIHSGHTTQRLMVITTLAMLPMMAASIWINGFDAVILLAASILSVLAMEVVCKWRITFEYNALVVGILLALMLPANATWWIAVLGAIIAIGVGKYLFGGLGQNIFNPAVLARVLLMTLFPAIFILPQWVVDGFSGATMLSKEVGAAMPSLSALFFTPGPGSLAQGMPIAVLLGGVILLVYKIIDWRVPLFYFATIALLALLLPGSDQITGHAPHLLGNPLLHIVAGGSLLTAFFLLTDPVTSPYSSNGRVVFAIIAGVFTMIIRYYTPYPDGAAFGVLLANAMVPAIDKYMLKSVVSTT
jgi:electron transport complex protein RnfD|tara:strand:+ start:2630 stop:3544 length:915 start_codon:yes stop_codon:yes gene_type:complete